MSARAVFWPPVRLVGFLRSAHRPLPSVAAWSSLPAARSSRAVRVRSSSSFSLAPLTMWNALCRRRHNAFYVDLRIRVFAFSHGETEQLEGVGGVVSVVVGGLGGVGPA